MALVIAGRINKVIAEWILRWFFSCIKLHVGTYNQIIKKIKILLMASIYSIESVLFKIYEINNSN